MPTKNNAAEVEEKLEEKPRPQVVAIDAFAEAFRQYTGSAAEGREAKPLPRRHARFDVDHSICSPGVFAEDFSITIAGLSSASELEATREAQADPIALGYAFARLSIVKVGPPGDGARDHVISSGEREWLWEALGQSGRQLVVSMFASALSAGDEAAGKARKSLRVF